MDIQIRKMQQGAALPFTFYRPVTGGQQAGLYDSDNKKKDDDEDSKGKLKLKDVFSLVNSLDGLPSDTNVITSMINSLYKTYSLDGEIDTDHLVTMYLLTINKLSIAKYNRREYDNAVTKVTNNEGLSEIAVTPYGQVYAWDKDSSNMAVVSVQDYLSNKDKYSPVTNEDLLKLRAENDSLAYKNDILKVVNNGVGTLKIREYLNNVISTMNSDKLELLGYTAKDAEKISDGMLILDLALSKGLIKNKEALFDTEGAYTTIFKNEDELRAARSAFEYLWKTLPENMRTVLAVKSGDAENPMRGALDLILTLIGVHSKSDRSFKMDYEGEDVRAAGHNKSATEKDRNIGPIELMYADIANPEQYRINGMTAHGFDIQARTFPIANAKIYDSLSSVLSTYSSAFNKNNISIGGSEVDPASLDQIVVMDSTLKTAELPCKTDDYGRLVPDWEAAKFEDKLVDLEKKGDVNSKSSEDRKPWSKEKINEYCRVNHVGIKYDRNGEARPMRQRYSTSRFALIEVAVDSAALPNDIKNTDFIKELSDSLKQSLLRDYRRNLGDKKYDFETEGIIFKDSHVYSGLVAVEIREGRNAAVQTADHNYLTTPKISLLDTQQRGAILQNELDRMKRSGGISLVSSLDLH